MLGPEPADVHKVYEQFCNLYGADKILSSRLWGLRDLSLEEKWEELERGLEKAIAKGKILGVPLKLGELYEIPEKYRQDIFAVFVYDGFFMGVTRAQTIDVFASLADRDAKHWAKTIIDRYQATPQAAN